MSRRAGMTTDDTKSAILRAATKVFAEKGFEGTSIAAITAEAGLSSGPIYVHFGSKTELFAATLEAHTDDELDRVLGATDKGDVRSVLAVLGSSVSRRHGDRGSLLVEAIVAARRDPAVEALVVELFQRRHRRIARMVDKGRASGEIDPRVSAQAVARFSMVIGLGSLLIGAVDHGHTDQEDWTRLMTSVVDGLTPR